MRRYQNDFLYTSGERARPVSQRNGIQIQFNGADTVSLSVEEWLRRREELQSIYVRCMGGFPKRCDLAPTLVREERTGEFLAQWVRFSGEPGERVPGLIR